MPQAEIEIAEVRSSADFKAFVKLPYSLYRNDPHWIPPLYFERKDFLHPKKNPFYRHGTVRLLLARRGGIPIGRISAHLDHEYEKRYGGGVGFFGFFECENDRETAHALFASAEQFLVTQGAKRILGPFNFSINQESGLLVEGFDQPLMTMTAYNPPYYLPIIESAGYRKAKDLFAWWYPATGAPEGPVQLAEAVAHYPGLKLRNINKKKLEEEIKLMMEVFNSAWANNWGFVPMTPLEIKKTAHDLKLILDPNIVWIAELNGDPAGICLTIPNIYEVIHDLKGRLFPFGFLKLLYRIKKKKWTTSRVTLLGVKKEYRESLKGLSVLLNVRLSQQGEKVGYKGAELSWTLEDNVRVNQGIEFMGGKKIKVFRIFEKELA